METPIPLMTPAPGGRLQRFVGDQLRFTVRSGDPRGRPAGWQARLRTNLGRGDLLRREIFDAHTRGLPLAGASWRDLPMPKDGDGWSLELPLTEPGYFKAKAYLLDPRGWQHWPEGPDFGLAVHPDTYRSANTIYCAFPRLFGPGKEAASTANPALTARLEPLDQLGYTVIPPSGKLRDLVAQLPHILGTLGCRILHLLPVNPTPTTYARFGRFGSPYAAQDLTAIDPALVVFDKRSTGVDQFQELTSATHRLGGRVFLDIVINHTGWGSTLQENHPEWFLRNKDGSFASPGAWGNTWEDLVELEQHDIALWDEISTALLIWCRRGVDGFRCDAGYKVPLAAWQYIIARVQQEFPETLFLLEGLGGALETTEALLTEGGMQWAYSELFQNYSGTEVARYLDYSNRQSEQVGLYVHYSETHDNERLAKRGRTWALLRHRLCALTSASGGFGFTCGGEWLAPEKIQVHGSTGLNWGSRENLIPELARLNRLIADHPCFLDGARITRLSTLDSPILALLRESAEGNDAVLVMVNTDVERSRTLELLELKEQLSAFKFELLGQTPPGDPSAHQKNLCQLDPGAAYCLAPTERPLGLAGDAYRRARARAAWALQALGKSFSPDALGRFDWRQLAERVDDSPAGFLRATSRMDPHLARTDLLAALDKAFADNGYPKVILWHLQDQHRVTPIPPEHWLLIEDTSPFRATLQGPDAGGDISAESPATHVQSIAAGRMHIACFLPGPGSGALRLTLDRHAGGDPLVEARLCQLASEPRDTPPAAHPHDLILLTNGLGAMARLGVDLGRVQSKYDCVLGANLHASLPVDRHVLAKRIRVWVNANGFISPLDFRNLASFHPGQPAVWKFVANAGDGQTVGVELHASLLTERNTTVFEFRRPPHEQACGKELPAAAGVSLTVRVDIEDRNFHWETRRNGGAEEHFSKHTHPLKGQAGFAFTAASERHLHVFADRGEYYPQPEWCENLPHPIEKSRGQTGSGDAFSPGWFDLPLTKETTVRLVITADKTHPTARELESGMRQPATAAGFFERLLFAARQFVVRRGPGQTVIAGYPWFLDWGRDTFICARGLLAAGLVDEVKQILLTFARFEKDGTLPNTIHGDDASNRDTSDAPLWFGIVCEEMAAITRTSGGDFYATPVEKSGRTIRDVLQSIAVNYSRGTPNGIRMDADSALIWSPSHFTWMDTNHPAGTPREGYPVEIQALWIRLLRLLEAVGETSQRRHWGDLATRAQASVEKWFWLESKGFYADVLIAGPGQSAAQAGASDALRCNCLFLVSLGLVSGARAQRCVETARRHLVVPGALRSLAPLPVSVPLPVYRDGHLLNNPLEPYWGRYEGDEDTRRKPAYHNGTAWTWTFPVFCEALLRAWDFSPAAAAAAKAYLGGMESLMNEGCLGQIPELLDGDAPHTQRGCDAQAWGVTEALRIWKMLS